MKEHNKNNKKNERDQQTKKFFDKMYRESLNDNLIDKTEYERICNIFTNYVDETKNETFL